MKKISVTSIRRRDHCADLQLDRKCLKAAYRQIVQQDALKCRQVVSVRVSCEDESCRLGLGEQDTGQGRGMNFNFHFIGIRTHKERQA
jgi:hypothetical protein